MKIETLLLYKRLQSNQRQLSNASDPDATSGIKLVILKMFTLNYIKKIYYIMPKSNYLLSILLWGGREMSSWLFTVVI